MSRFAGMQEIALGTRARKCGSKLLADVAGLSDAAYNQPAFACSDEVHGNLKILVNSMSELLDSPRLCHQCRSSVVERAIELLRVRPPARLYDS